MGLSVRQLLVSVTGVEGQALKSADRGGGGGGSGARKGGKLGLWRLLLLLLELDPPNPSQLTKEGFQGSRETQPSPWPKGRGGYKAE